MKHCITVVTKHLQFCWIKLHLYYIISLNIYFILPPQSQFNAIYYQLINIEPMHSNLKLVTKELKILIADKQLDQATYEQLQTLCNHINLSIVSLGSCKNHIDKRLISQAIVKETAQLHTQIVIAIDAGRLPNSPKLMKASSLLYTKTREYRNFKSLHRFYSTLPKS